jgi:hypothetical protein
MNNATVKITRAIPTTNNSPAGEGPNNAFDNNPYSKYLNFDKKNAGVTVQLNTGRVVTGFTVTTANDFSGRDPTSYKLYGSNDGVNWTLIKEDSLSLSNNRYSTSAVISVGNTAAYAYYFMLFPTTKAGEGCGLDCDSMQIAELTYYYDANSTVTSTATSSTVVDPVTASAPPPTPVYGNSGLTAAQQSRLNAAIQNINLGQGNTIDATIHGDNNDVFITQADGAHYLQLGIIGNQNTVNVTQSSINYHNYLEINIVGNTNLIDVLQTGANDKTAFVTVNGNNNNANVIQKDTGRHYLQLDLLSNGNTATVVQEGSGDHSATVTLNGSQPWNFNLTQSGATGKIYTLPHAMSDGSSVSGTCNSIGGCNLTVNQQ